MFLLFELLHEGFQVVLDIVHDHENTVHVAADDDFANSDDIHMLRLWFESNEKTRL